MTRNPLGRAFDGLVGLALFAAAVSCSDPNSSSVTGPASADHDGSVPPSGNPTEGGPDSGGPTSPGTPTASGDSSVEDGATTSAPMSGHDAGQTADAGQGSNLTDGSITPSDSSPPSSGTPDASGGASEGGGADSSVNDGGGATSTRSAGCGKALTRPDPALQQTMQVQGITRYALVYVPTTYAPDVAMPVIFVFHGHGMNNVWAALDSNGSFALKAATKNAAILVYPQGTGDPPGTTCQGCGTFINSSWTSSGNDLAFFDALVADTESRYCIDTHRVFAAGFSQGAMFSNDLGCLRSNVVRAVAPVEGAGPNGTCAASGMPAIVTHGTGDTVIPYATGQASATFWATLDGCATTTAQSLSGCVSYQTCRPDAPVAFCTHSGGHTVPSNAGANIWSFFNTLK